MEWHSRSIYIPRAMHLHELQLHHGAIFGQIQVHEDKHRQFRGV